MYEFLGYLNDHPTVADILMAVHKVKVKKSGKWKKQDEEEFMNSFYQVPEFGMDANRASDDFRDSVKFGMEMQNKLKIN